MTERLLPVDKALPHLAELLDANRMAPRLAAWLSEAHGAFLASGCHIDRIKYRPGRNCVVSYLVRSLHEPPRRVTVTTYVAGELEHRYEQALAFRSGIPESASGAPRPGLLRDIASVAVPFPQDRKLDALPRLLDSPEWVLGNDAIVAFAKRKGVAIEAGIRQQVVSYLPGHSCTVKVDFKDGANREGVTPHLYGKVSYSDNGARAAHGMQSLTRLEATQQDLGGAELVHHDAANRILWQAGIDAPTLADCAAGSGDQTDLWQRMGAATACFHGMPSSGAHLLTLSMIHDAILRASELVSSAVPGSSAAMASVTRGLMRLGHVPDPGPLATLHGDLHSRNALVAPGRIHFIDLDRVSAGPALAELGSLAAERISGDCIAGRPVDVRVIHELVLGYERRSGSGVPREDFNWHVAAALVRERAQRAVTALKPGRFESLPALLRSADDILCGTLDLLPFAQSSRGRALAREAS